jgi:isoleucyl-tRNA synthetase
VSLDVAGEATDFTFEEIQVVENGIDPYVAGSDSGITVAMDCTLTEELKEEGLAREIINRIQNLRKSNGLEVSDRILLSIDGSELVQTAVSKWGDYIASETLAEFGDDEFEISDTFPVDDVEVKIALQRR